MFSLKEKFDRYSCERLIEKIVSLAKTGKVKPYTPMGSNVYLLKDIAEALGMDRNLLWDILFKINSLEIYCLSLIHI